MSNDPTPADAGDDPPTDAPPLVAARAMVAVPDSPTETPDAATATPAERATATTPTPRVRESAPEEPVELVAELDVARNHVLDAIAAWLAVTWEQPIVRAINSNAGSALDNADRFPALRTALRALQANAPQTVELTIAPLFDADQHMRDQALVSSVDAAALVLVGMIGGPLKDAGFDPLSGGLERTQDGFRLKAMTEHADMSAALQTYNKARSSLAEERAARAERNRESARLEVERLWKATADLP